MAALSARRLHPGWTFSLLWVAATFVGGFVYVIPVVAVHLVLGLDRLEDPQGSGEITAWMLVLAAVLCSAACGSTIGLGQWLVLRRRIKGAGLWVAATIAGYASIGVLPLIVAVFRPDWLDWALKMVINGKMHWLAREQPSWPGASWGEGAITLTMFGVLLGIAQWIVLQGRVDRAGWWIALSAAGWILVAALGLLLPWEIFVSTFSVPSVVQAMGLVWLLRHPRP